MSGEAMLSELLVSHVETENTIPDGKTPAREDKYQAEEVVVQPHENATREGIGNQSPTFTNPALRGSQSVKQDEDTMLPPFRVPKWGSTDCFHPLPTGKQVRKYLAQKAPYAPTHITKRYRTVQPTCKHHRVVPLQHPYPFQCGPSPRSQPRRQVEVQCPRAASKNHTHNGNGGQGESNASTGPTKASSKSPRKPGKPATARPFNEVLRRQVHYPRPSPYEEILPIRFLPAAPKGARDVDVTPRTQSSVRRSPGKPRRPETASQLRLLLAAVDATATRGSPRPEKNTSPRGQPDESWAFDNHMRRTAVMYLEKQRTPRRPLSAVGMSRSFREDSSTGRQKRST